MVENIVRKGEIACSKQFLLFSQCFPQLYIFSASKCGIVWLWLKQKQALMSEVCVTYAATLQATGCFFFSNKIA